MERSPKQKSLAHLEAQLACYLVGEHRHVPPSLSYKALADTARDLLMLHPGDQEVKRVASASSPHATAQHLHDLPASYQKFLRDPRTEHARLREISQYIEQFEAFKNILPRLGCGELPEVGRGCYSRVFQLEHNGVSFAVRVPEDRADRPVMEEIYHKVDALVRVADVPGMEKLVAVSYIEGVTISELAAGVELSTLTVNELRQIPEWHVDELRANLSAARKRDVIFDAAGDNLLYHHEKGFTAIDLHVNPHSIKTVDEQIATAIARAVAKSIERQVNSKN